MSSTPKGAERDRRTQIEIASEAQGVEPDFQLPDPGPAEIFISLLSEIGEGKPGSGGLQPIDWMDIAAWMDITGSEITPGEAVAIKNLSVCYVSQYYKSVSPDCPAPHIESLPNSDAVVNQLKTLFRMLRK